MTGKPRNVSKAKTLFLLTWGILCFPVFIIIATLECLLGYMFYKEQPRPPRSGADGRARVAALVKQAGG